MTPADLVTSTGELAEAVRTWVHESVTLFRYMLEEVYPPTDGLGRTARREIMLIHVRKGERMLEDGTAPETNPADALREAVVWYELRQKSGADPKDAEPPRWVSWAYRMLPDAGLSRYARLSLETAELAEAGL